MWNQLSDNQENLENVRCPSCQKISSFVYIGQQKWPEKVARKMGVPQLIRLYVCQSCKTTVSEMFLHDSDSSIFPEPTSPNNLP